MGARVNTGRGSGSNCASRKQLAARRRGLCNCIETLESRRLLSTVIGQFGQEAPPTLAPTKGGAPAAPIGPQASFWIGDQRILVTQRTDRLLIGAEEGMNLDTIKQMLLDEALGDDDQVQRVNGSTLFIDPAGTAAAAASMIAAAAIPGIAWVVPTFTIAGTGAEIGIGNEVIVKLGAGEDPAEVFGQDQQVLAFRPLRGTPDEFVLTLDESAGLSTLAQANLLKKDDHVQWAEPNLYHFVQLSATTNDPQAPQQWHLNNTGQTGAKVGADAKVQGAWDHTTGSPSVVTAIVDAGVDTAHPDLAANIWVNVGEIAANGIDDDGNGWIDDVNGWDFSDNDNNPNPATTFDNHGTAVAGVTSAVGNNALGVTGVAYNSKIQGVKIFKDTVGNGGGITTTALLTEAIYYAAGRTADGSGTWNSATVQNHSWGGPGPFPTSINNAFAYSNTTARGGKGQPVFAATGNSASDFGRFQLSGLPLSSWQFEWRYVKDGSIVSGLDTAFLGWVVLPDGSVQRFDSASLPAGWTTNGSANWSIVDDPAHSVGVGRYTAKAGTIGHSQTTAIRSPVVVGASDLFYSAWVSSEAGFDELQLWYSQNGSAFAPFSPFDISGVNVFNPFYTTVISAPANIPGNIAVGASTDWDYRSDYSQYGTGLDFVAPSNGGFAGITTTDRAGAPGYSTGDYTNAFGGTSSATPLAAGIGALILSKNPNLTAAQVRDIMRGSADKIGGVTYTGGFNQFYGYGRLNAAAALAATPPPVATGGIAGQTYEDRDGSGTFNAGDVALNGVTVFIDSDLSGTLNGSEPSVVTSGSGDYAFNGLAAGTYRIREIIPSGFFATAPTGGSTDVLVAAAVVNQNFGNFRNAFTGTAGADSYLVRLDAATQNRTEILINGVLTWSIPKNNLGGLTFNAGAGDDTLNVSHVNGLMPVATTIQYDGGAHTTGDSLILTGGTAGDTGSVIPGTFQFNNTQVNHSLNETFTFNGGTGPDALHIVNGTYNFNADAQAGTAGLHLSVQSLGTVNFNASQHLASLTIDGNANLSAGGSKVIVTNALTVGSGGKLNLRNHDLIVNYGGAPIGTAGGIVVSPIGTASGGVYDGLTGRIQSAHNGGAWDGNGITTTEADALGGLTTLGIAEASDILGLGPTNTDVWNGETVDGTTILVKYTYAGDGNLDGQITGDDYSLIDFNIAVPNAFGYYNGDFNYDGIISGDDYSVIDFNIVAQGGPL